MIYIRLYQFYDAEKLTYKRSFRAHKKPIKTFVWSGKFKIIASADEERLMYII